MRERASTPLHVRGLVLPHGELRDVYVVDGRITFERPAGAVTTVLEHSYLLPGLVDAHAHLSLFSPAGDSAAPDERVRASARAQLAAGALLVREPGSPDDASMEVGPDGGLPRVQTGGRFLAPPGRYFPGLAREVSDLELPEAAAEEGRRSGAWVKIIGDFSGSDGDVRPNFSRSAMSEAAQAARDVGARITVHATMPESIEIALEAGFDAIEHGIGLRDEHITVMAERCVALTPTLGVSSMLAASPEILTRMGYSPEALTRTVHELRRHPEMVRRAAEAGVMVMAGTDAGMGPHGMIAGEIQLLVAAGLSIDVALAAASWAARSYLGLAGIEEGAPADIVAYAADPRDRDGVTQAPAAIILDGVLLSH